MGFHFAMAPVALQAQSKCLLEGDMSPYVLDRSHSFSYGTEVRVNSEMEGERGVLGFSC
jgi:hypothetical protein